MAQRRRSDATRITSRAVSALLACALALGACGPFVNEYAWQPYAIAEARVASNDALAAGGTVAIVNADTDSRRCMFAKLGPNEFYAAANHLGESVATQLADELRKRRFTVDGAAPKTLRIKVTRPSVTAVTRFCTLR